MWKWCKNSVLTNETILMIISITFYFLLRKITGISLLHSITSPQAQSLVFPDPILKPRRWTNDPLNHGQRKVPRQKNMSSCPHCTLRSSVPTLLLVYYGYYITGVTNRIVDFPQLKYTISTTTTTVLCVTDFRKLCMVLQLETSQT